MNLNFLLVFGFVLVLHSISAAAVQEPRTYSNDDDLSQDVAVDNELNTSVSLDSTANAPKDLRVPAYHRYNPGQFALSDLASLYRVPARLSARSVNQQRSQQPTWYLGKRSRGSWHLG